MATILKNSKYTEINQSPQSMLRWPLPFATGIIIRSWLDFYEDDMLPWVLSSIHIQRHRLSNAIQHKWGFPYSQSEDNDILDRLYASSPLAPRKFSVQMTMVSEDVRGADNDLSRKLGQSNTVRILRKHKKGMQRRYLFYKLMGHCPVAVFRVRNWSRSNGPDQLIQDFLLEIFGIHVELDGEGEPVLVTLAPPIRNSTY